MNLWIEEAMRGQPDRRTDGQINTTSLEIHPNTQHYTASSHFRSYFLSSLSFSPALLFFNSSH